MPRDALRLIVADDERLARELVHQYVRNISDIEVVCECADTATLQSALERVDANAALLDIRMPGLDIFEVLANVARQRQLPAVIFATAYDRYAVRAFEISAVDYLVKPFGESRFMEALTRLRERLQSGAEAGNMAGLLRDLGRRPDRLLVPERDKIVPLPISQITWIRAEGDYARIYSNRKSYLVYRTLNNLESRLNPAEFLRVHRSVIVRVDQIAELCSIGSGRYELRLSDGSRLVASRSRAGALKKLML